jgi:hypothetical protein
VSARVAAIFSEEHLLPEQLTISAVSTREVWSSANGTLKLGYHFRSLDRRPDSELTFVSPAHVHLIWAYSMT